MRINIDVLLAKGYRIVDTQPAQKMTMENILNDIFSYFDDYPKMGFSFIYYPDEIIVISNNANELFKVFGYCIFGFFVIDSHEHILILPNEGLDFNDDKVYVNRSLAVFLQCYSLFLSKIFLLKSKIFDKDTDEVALVELANNTANKLMQEIACLDKKALKDDGFWCLMIYIMQELEIKLNLPISEYINSNRL
ncbi:hypothetical protein [Psychrobacter sp. I-STPA10]|uniref:hypothetical protein n=1 Tax=Psychrobacter sp. I-STPA10 TaxID=2585769 RepID=UPI001E5CDDE5|nr:hypothetical protein [Psychrobacter sp. I-STPA10]